MSPPAQPKTASVRTPNPVGSLWMDFRAHPQEGAMRRSCPPTRAWRSVVPRSRAGRAGLICATLPGPRKSLA